MAVKYLSKKCTYMSRLKIKLILKLQSIIWYNLKKIDALIFILCEVTLIIINITLVVITNILKRPGMMPKLV